MDSFWSLPMDEPASDQGGNGIQAEITQNHGEWILSDVVLFIVRPKPQAPDKALTFINETSLSQPRRGETI